MHCRYFDRLELDELMWYGEAILRSLKTFINLAKFAKKKIMSFRNICML